MASSLGNTHLLRKGPPLWTGPLSPFGALPLCYLSNSLFLTPGANTFSKATADAEGGKGTMKDRKAMAEAKVKIKRKKPAKEKKREKTENEQATFHQVVCHGVLCFCHVSSEWGWGVGGSESTEQLHYIKTTCIRFLNMKNVETFRKQPWQNEFLQLSKACSFWWKKAKPVKPDDKDDNFGWILGGNNEGFSCLEGFEVQVA